MFEAFYINRALELVQKLPKEVIAATAAYALITELYTKHTQVQKMAIKANADIKVAELTFETERLRLEIEQLKRNRPIQ